MNLEREQGSPNKTEEYLFIIALLEFVFGVYNENSMFFHG